MKMGKIFTTFVVPVVQSLSMCCYVNCNIKILIASLMEQSSEVADSYELLQSACDINLKGSDICQWLWYCVTVN